MLIWFAQGNTQLGPKSKQSEEQRQTLRFQNQFSTLQVVPVKRAGASLASGALVPWPGLAVCPQLSTQPEGAGEVAELCFARWAC